MVLELVKLPQRERVQDFLRPRVAILVADFSGTHRHGGLQVPVVGHFERRRQAVRDEEDVKVEHWDVRRGRSRSFAAPDISQREAAVALAKGQSRMPYKGFKQIWDEASGAHTSMRFS